MIAAGSPRLHRSSGPESLGERLRILRVPVLVTDVQDTDLAASDHEAHRVRRAIRDAAIDNRVLVETSGSEEIGPLDPRVHVIMDLKCPGSGEMKRNRWENLEHLDGGDEVKFVILDRADYEWACDVVRERGLDRRVRDGTLRAILFSPVWDALDRQELAEWILEDGLPVRFQTQLHKHIWDPMRKGA